MRGGSSRIFLIPEQHCSAATPAVPARSFAPDRGTAYIAARRAAPGPSNSPCHVSTYHRRRLVEIKHAFDEARFGADRTLNLRAQLPTAADAAHQANAWLRERQAAGAREALIITGRGNSSDGGLSVVREAVSKTLRILKRQGVVEGVTEHSPGSFVATLAPMRRLWEGGHRTVAARSDMPGASSLNGLEPETEVLLRRLAERSLATLGVRDTAPFVEREMATLFAMLLRGVPAGDRRDERLRDVIRRALDDDDGRTR